MKVLLPKPPSLTLDLEFQQRGNVWCLEDAQHIRNLEGSFLGLPMAEWEEADAAPLPRRADKASINPWGQGWEGLQAPPTISYSMENKLSQQAPPSTW